ncbi:MAG TPA: FAD/NAD(P)-binding protein [Dongiaceae bacterium]|nr:FAD/NAD(P)-binding protein [Dongiaceae bacterium]
MTSAIETRIAIIGAGFSGSLLAVQLLQRFLPNARIYLIEKGAQFGRGLAYATGNPNHLLNVRAGRMSAFADDPDHFVRWLGQSLEARAGAGSALIRSDTFVPRRLYGAYIQELLGNEIWQSGKGRNLFLVPDEAVSIQPRTGGLVIEVRGGRRYDVEAAVLAIGNFPNDDVSGHYHGDPWSPHALAELDADAPVLLIGTGLTMVDTVVSLLDRGHRGPIHAVSRRGLLPRRHADAPPHIGINRATLASPSVTDLLQEVRRVVRGKDSDEATWRSVVDGIRPFTQELWQSLSDAEKARFLRHLRPWWDVHRHRMAPDVADVIDRAVAAGRLTLSAARVQAMESDPDGVTITLRRRGADQTEQLRAARVIDCSGPQYDYARINSDLVQNLLAQGSARPDAHHLGLDVTYESAIVDRRGVPSRRLYALGPVTRGTFWEITSVPDIREQCWNLARLLAGRLATRELEFPPPPAVKAARSLAAHR